MEIENSLDGISIKVFEQKVEYIDSNGMFE